MKIEFSNSFDFFSNDERSRVFQLIPDCYSDNRGFFMEVLKDRGEFTNNDIPKWIGNTDWIKQINRSASKQGVVRGCHAQRGRFCQGKLVEATTDMIFDIITDARPESKTFGVSSVFVLDPEKHNLLWVPRGFLHCVVFPTVKDQSILQYYCDQVYDHDSEFCVNPMTLIPDVVKTLKNMGNNDEFSELFDMFDRPDDIIYSEKDINNRSYEDFVDDVKTDYDHGIIWYK